jgi:hypothetical protein
MRKQKITVPIFPDEIVLGILVIMRFSVHLCQRKFLNKHLRFCIHISHASFIPPVVAKNYVTCICHDGHFQFNWLYGFQRRTQIPSPVSVTPVEKTHSEIIETVHNRWVQRIQRNLTRSDDTQDRTTTRVVKKIWKFFSPFSSLFDPFPRDSFPRTKTIFFSSKKKIQCSSPGTSKTSRPMSPLPKDFHRSVSEMESNNLLRSTVTDDCHMQKDDQKTCLFYGLNYFWRPIRCRTHLGLAGSTKQV